MKPIYLIISTALLIATFLTGHRAGWQQRQKETYPEVNEQAKTISGLLHQCPPKHISIVLPEQYTRLDTVEGRGAYPFQKIVIVISGQDTLGFYQL